MQVKGNKLDREYLIKPNVKKKEHHIYEYKEILVFISTTLGEGIEKGKIGKRYERRSNTDILDFRVHMMHVRFGYK